MEYSLKRNLIILYIDLILQVFSQTQSTQVIKNVGDLPGTLRLDCGFSSITWSLDGTALNYGNDAKTTLFTFGGGMSSISNTIPLNADYIGTYVCRSGSSDESISYTVLVNGASKTLSGGAIAGIVIAVLLAIIILVALIYYAFTKQWFGYCNDDEENANEIDNDVNINDNASSKRFIKPSSHNSHNMNYT